MSVDNDIAYKKLDMLQKKLDAKIATNHQKLSKEQSTLKDVEIMRRGNIPPAQFAQIAHANPKNKYYERSITARSGNRFLVDDPKQKQKLMEILDNNASALLTIDQLKRVVPKLHWAKRLPGAGRVSVDARTAENAAKSLVGKLRIELFGPGVMTDNERAQAMEIIGDPTAFAALDKTKIAALDNIAWKLKYAQREYLRRAGVNVPKTRNDLMVDQRLKSLGLNPKAVSPFQKRDAMDYLIRSERAARVKKMEGKPVPKNWVPGKYWNKDEPSIF